MSNEKDLEVRMTLPEAPVLPIIGCPRLSPLREVSAAQKAVKANRRSSSFMIETDMLEIEICLVDCSDISKVSEVKCRLRISIGPEVVK